MNRNIKRTFRKEYDSGYGSARELTLELLDRYKSVVQYQSSYDETEAAIKAVEESLYDIDMSYWRDDTSPDQIMTMIREIEKYLVIIKSSSSTTFINLEEKVNTALKRCVDVLAAA